MTRLLRWIGLLCAVNGCFHHRNDIALLEGELRWMEDQLYTLEDDLALKSSQLAECRDSRGNCCPPEVIYDGPVVDRPMKDSSSGTVRPDKPEYEVVPSETDTLRVPNRLDRQVPTLAEPPAYEVLDDSNDGGIEDGGRRSKTPARNRSAAPPGVAVPYEITTPPDLLTPPDELSEPEPPQISPPPPDASLHRTTPVEDAPIRLSSHVELAPEPETAPDTANDGADVFVTHILARAWLAHDHGFDGRPADVDLLVVVEPRNVDGEPVLLGGPLSIVVLDASQPKESARVARWDYSAPETRRLMQTTSAGRGIHLELQWPGEAPSTDQLQAFVRYVTVEDRQLEHDVAVALQRPEEPIARTGWRSNTRRPPAKEANEDDHDEPTRIASSIKLRPIPKDRSPGEATEPALIDHSSDEPIILDDERPPQWSPERH